MSHYTKVNISEVTDQARNYGMAEIGEARFARQALGAERIGAAYYRINPGKRLGFGHRHSESEEAYFVISCTGRFKVQDDIIEVGSQDIVYVAPDALREWEAGDGGMEILAFGAHTEGEDSTMEQGWWTG